MYNCCSAYILSLCNFKRFGKTVLENMPHQNVGFEINIHILKPFRSSEASQTVKYVNN